ncbi:MAG: methionyl-tRNA formyltransferase [Vulcanimicrobiaceae bacterium]
MRAVAKYADLAGVVTQPDRPAGRGHKLTPTPIKKAALELGVPVYEPLSLKAFVEQHESETYDLFVLASYGKILPASLLAMPKYGALNVHPSLLPKYRGATPLQTALLNGDTETGLTIMLMDAGMDTGPIVLQERTEISPEEDYGALHDRLAVLGARLVTQAIASVRSGLHAQPQRGEPTVTRPIRKEDLKIDWTWNAQRIVNTVRAFAPQPAARAVIGNAEVKVLAAQCTPSPEAIAVPCAGGSVYVTRLVAAGKAPMSGGAFGRHLGRAV